MFQPFLESKRTNVIKSKEYYKVGGAMDIESAFLSNLGLQATSITYRARAAACPGE
jgi:hypothetical protein